jgi:hypothetical protein
MRDQEITIYTNIIVSNKLTLPFFSKNFNNSVALLPGLRFGLLHVF